MTAGDRAAWFLLGLMIGIALGIRVHILRVRVEPATDELARLREEKASA